jgi:tetratricopeptide (TPR) repeat protein
MKLKRKSLVSQGSLSRMLHDAMESWKRCDFQSAIDTMERISRLDPGNPAIFLDLGGLYGKRYDYANAERCFEQGIRIASKKSEALAVAGQKCCDFRKEDMAEGYLRRAVEQKDASPATLVKLAEVYERSRRLEEAEALVDRALHADAVCGPALLLRARLDRQAKRLDNAEKLLRAFPVNSEPALRISAKYELGNILDRKGQYDEAMAIFLEAKALLQPQAERAAAELKVMRNRIGHLIATVSSEQLQQWSDSASSLQPRHRLALLGGHPRSGTTLLEQVVDSHPEVVSVEETEIFYNEAYGPLLPGHPDDTAMYAALTQATPERLQQSRQNYFRAMELSLGKPVGGRLLIDKNPSYTFLIPAFVRIFPETTFLIALRDPRDVVLSCFMQNIPLNQVGAAYLSLASAAEEYVALMGTWQGIKSRLRNPYLEVRYEDMVEDLETVARRTLEFLGVSWDAKVLGFDEHARQKMVRSPTYADVTQPVYKRAVGRWRNYQKYLEPHLGTLEPFVKAFGYE